jgi:hypothetical protein
VAVRIVDRLGVPDVSLGERLARGNYVKTTKEGAGMRRDDFVDFHMVPDGQLVIHERLLEWARWVRVRPHGWQTSPMFRQYRSHAWQWERPSPRVEVNVPQALEVEKAVSLLPEKHRDAVRWHYVFAGGPVPMAKRLGVSKQGLADLVIAGRFMLMNRGV